jgi:hypothetical protein
MIRKALSKCSNVLRVWIIIFTFHAQRMCWEISEARSISESKKIKFEYSFEWIGWEIGENIKIYFITLKEYTSELV